MEPRIARVQSRGELKAFVRLPLALYAHSPLWVPPLMQEQMETLDPARNPAFQQAEARLFLAYQGARAVGRVAAIHSRAANQHQGARNLRFGWFETIEDYDVAQALLGAVEDWARQLNLATITGPQGFCDFDPQGLLIEGFEHLPTMATIYNHSYYPGYLERYGFSKDVDYVELQLSRARQGGLPARVRRLAEAVEKRGQVRLLELGSRRQALAWLPQVLEVLNESFADLYGEVPLTPQQMRYYGQRLMLFLDKDLLLGMVDRANHLVGFAIALPSLSRALQKARGRLLPWGWWHLWRGLRAEEIVDFYLVGVRRRYQGQGLAALVMARLYERIMAKGFALAESNPILEGNALSLALYQPFQPLLHKRRRVYIKQVGQEPPATDAWPGEEKHGLL